jgi:hypothetical protein
MTATKKKPEVVERDLSVIPEIKRELEWFKDDLEEFEEFKTRLSNLQGALSSLADLADSLGGKYEEQLENLWKKYNYFKDNISALQEEE